MKSTLPAGSHVKLQIVTKTISLNFYQSVMLHNFKQASGLHESSLQRYSFIALAIWLRLVLDVPSVRYYAGSCKPCQRESA